MKLTYKAYYSVSDLVTKKNVRVVGLASQPVHQRGLSAPAVGVWGLFQL